MIFFVGSGIFFSLSTLIDRYLLRNYSFVVFQSSKCYLIIVLILVIQYRSLIQYIRNRERERRREKNLPDTVQLCAELTIIKTKLVPAVQFILDIVRSYISSLHSFGHIKHGLTYVCFPQDFCMVLFHFRLTYRNKRKKKKKQSGCVLYGKL